MSAPTMNVLPPKVLIVDDDPDIVEVLQEFLSEDNYRFVIANDGAEAVGKAATEKPDMMLLDIGLSKLDGYEVCRWVRADEQTRALPIIVITSQLDFADRQSVIDAGADDFLIKAGQSPGTRRARPCAAAKRR